MLSENNITTN